MKTVDDSPRRFVPKGRCTWAIGTSGRLVLPRVLEIAGSTTRSRCQRLAGRSEGRSSFNYENEMGVPWCALPTSGTGG